MSVSVLGLGGAPPNSLSPVNGPFRSFREIFMCCGVGGCGTTGADSVPFAWPRPAVAVSAAVGTPARLPVFAEKCEPCLRRLCGPVERLVFDMCMSYSDMLFNEICACTQDQKTGAQNRFTASFLSPQQTSRDVNAQTSQFRLGLTPTIRASRDWDIISCVRVKWRYGAQK